MGVSPVDGGTEKRDARPTLFLLDHYRLSPVEGKCNADNDSKAEDALSKIGVDADHIHSVAGRGTHATRRIIDAFVPVMS
jgi:hypothetical protein